LEWLQIKTGFKCEKPQLTITENKNKKTMRTTKNKENLWYECTWELEKSRDIHSSMSRSRSPSRSRWRIRYTRF